jgi:hypothetical protein
MVTSDALVTRQDQQFSRIAIPQVDIETLIGALQAAGVRDANIPCCVGFSTLYMGCMPSTSVNKLGTAGGSPYSWINRQIRSESANGLVPTSR